VSRNAARILVAGESWQVFSIHTKGFDSFFTADYAEGVSSFRQVLEAAGHVVEFQPNHVAAEKFPDTEAALGEFNAVVLSDIGSNTLLMPSATFMRAQPRPNRLMALRNWVASGGALAMIGGYLSFQGIEGKANYRATPLAEVLPVELELGDDRQEAPEGAVPRVTNIEHPVTAGITDEWPALLGFQRLAAKHGAEVLATIGDWPLLVVGRFGQGRVLAFASDIGPHWAPPSFTEWPGYSRLWGQAITWLVDR
jgi:uncharacterized membrane protein